MLMLLLCMVLLIAPVTVLSAASVPPKGLIPYDEIGPLLAEIAAESDRVQVEVIGESVAGREMYLVTVADPQEMGRLGHYKALRQMMIRDPEKAQEMIDQFEDFLVPVFINASIHGNEYEGVDAAIDLIKTLDGIEEPEEPVEYEVPEEEIEAILDNMFLLVNVVANPDGRVLGQRRNSNGFDLNRDFITQSQPETEVMAGLIAEWNPMVLLDLHGYYYPMLIEPCTPPHNPNVEYDLFIKWALDLGVAMEAELLAQTGMSAQIPYRDWEDGWDDWAPIYTPMYAMYHGSYAFTLETPNRQGVDAHYAAAWGALRFVTENRKEMIWDQVEIFRRGFLDLDQVPISDELLAETPYDQYNELTTIDFPAAYLIPAEGPLQMSSHQAARLVNFLRFNDVQVSVANGDFTAEGVDYLPGTYVVWMNQPKRGLANTILWDGWDISYDPGLDMYDISSWSHAPLWGVTRMAVEESPAVATTLLRRDAVVTGSVSGASQPVAYAFRPTSNQAILATNYLLADQNAPTVWRATDSFGDFGVGTILIPPDARLADELARTYGLEVTALGEIPQAVEVLTAPKVAVVGDEGITWFLETYNFDYSVIRSNDFDGGALADYDVLIVQSSLPGSAALEQFFVDGGDLVGIGSVGANLAVDLGLAPGLGYASQSGNGIVLVDYDPDDPISAQYPADDYAFVYRPTWFTEVPEEEWQVSGHLDAGDDFFLSGFWSGWQESDAAGEPIVIHREQEDSAITLIGFDPTFRAHPEQTYRILANALYSWVE
jgi:hypothetical protein